MSEPRGRRTPLGWVGFATWALVRLALLLGCFALAYYVVVSPNRHLLIAGYAGTRLLAGNPSGVATWFVGSAVAHDLVLFPLYAGGDRILSLLLRALPSTRVPLVNHIRIPVLGAGLSLLMFLPGIIRQGGATTFTAAGLDQEPYRERWVWLAVGLFAVSALIWGVRTIVELISPADSPGHDQEAVHGDREDGLDGEPPADLTAGKQAAREDQPHPER